MDRDLPRRRHRHLEVTDAPDPEARHLAAAVRSGRRRAAEVIHETLTRIEASQPALNAFTFVDVDGALRRAAELDRRIAAGEDPGPLAGVPVAVKDIIDQQGLPNTKGGSFEPTIPTRSATVVERLEAAGAIVVGRTGLHEFAFGYTSENHWFGPVRNPWDPSLSPGGSSGGSAAAVAAGVVPVALGTDTGGSVRVPAALCGIVGLKVTHGRVSLRGVYPLAASLDTVGPLTRNVDDALLVFGVIAGDDPADPWSAPLPVPPPEPPVPVGRLRVTVPRPWIDGPVAATVAGAFTRFLDELVAAGATVTEIHDPVLLQDRAARTGAYVEVAAVQRERFAAHPEAYGPDVAARLADAVATPAGALVEALRWRAGARHVAMRLLADHDVLVLPTVGATRKMIGDDQIDVDGTPVFHRTLLARHAAPINGIGFPAVSLPLPGDAAPPPAVQLVGRPFEEPRLLAAAAGLVAAGLVEVRRPPNWFGPAE